MKRQQRAVEAGKLVRLCDRLDVVGSRIGPVRTMVSEELLFEIKPMNSTDMIWLQLGKVKAEREAAGGDSGGVVLRGMNAPHRASR